MFSGRTDSREAIEEEREEDALASNGEEGRGELRKATVSRRQAMTRGCPNGETRADEVRAPAIEAGANPGN